MVNFTNNHCHDQDLVIIIDICPGLDLSLQHHNPHHYQYYYSHDHDQNNDIHPIRFYHDHILWIMVDHDHRPNHGYHGSDQ